MVSFAPTGYSEFPWLSAINSNKRKTVSIEVAIEVKMEVVFQPYAHMVPHASTLEGYAFMHYFGHIPSARKLGES
jgi:hypothetical protein